MSDRSAGQHPDVDVLASYVAGLLDKEENEITRRHVEECQICRLETKRMERFEKIDSDAALLEEAEWETARFALERRFHESVLPQVLPGEAERGPVAERIAAKKRFWSRWQVRWLAPVAAAAAVVLVVLQMDRAHPPSVDDLGPMRGTTTESAEVFVVSPVGEIGEFPRVFSWRSDRLHDYYTVEIFASDLSKMFEVDGITERRWVPSDSLISLLKLDTVYLWSVTAHRGLKREVVSPNGWFKVTSADSVR
jgi:hypothetical protein